MAKKVKKVSGSVRHNANAPCQQMFNVGAKPGTKQKTWWNGYRPSAAKPSDF